jgi:hypothetical protein
MAEEVSLAIEADEPPSETVIILFASVSTGPVGRPR